MLMINSYISSIFNDLSEYTQREMFEWSPLFGKIEFEKAVSIFPHCFFFVIIVQNICQLLKASAYGNLKRSLLLIILSQYFSSILKQNVANFYMVVHSSTVKSCVLIFILQIGLGSCLQKESHAFYMAFNRCFY